MSTLETQYKNWLLKNLNSQLTYVNWLEKFNEIHNLPSDMSDWDVTLMDGLEDEPYISDDFQIGPDGAYEHTDDMVPGEKAEKYAEGYRCPATNEMEYCRHDIISAYNTGYTQCQKDMADKKLDEDDIKEMALDYIINTGGLPKTIEEWQNALWKFYQSLNKQD